MHAYCLLSSASVGDATPAGTSLDQELAKFEEAIAEQEQQQLLQQQQQAEEVLDEEIEDQEIEREATELKLDQRYAHAHTGT